MGITLENRTKHHNLKIDSSLPPARNLFILSPAHHGLKINKHDFGAFSGILLGLQALPLQRVEEA